MNPLLQFGFFSRTHGLGGDLVAKTFDKSSEAMFDVERILARRRDGVEEELKLREVNAMPKGEIRVRIDGITTREKAEGYIGSALFVFRDDLEPPEGDEFFQGDLLGLQAYDVAGTLIGTVEEVWNTGPVPNLAIRKDGVETLVPLLDAYVKSLDFAARRMVIELPEYA